MARDFQGSITREGFSFCKIACHDLIEHLITHLRPVFTQIAFARSRAGECERALCNVRAQGPAYSDKSQSGLPGWGGLGNDRICHCMRKGKLGLIGFFGLALGENRTNGYLNLFEYGGGNFGH